MQLHVEAAKGFFCVFNRCNWTRCMGKSERLQGGNDHVCTPEKIWGPIVKHFGGIALDPMSNPKSRVPAKVKYTDWGPQAKLPRGWTQKDGMAARWTGFDKPVFVNGPYSNDPNAGLKKWFAKALQTRGEDPRAEIICFGPVRTSGQAWQHYGWYADSICLLNFRVKHDYEKDTSPFHQALLYFGPRASFFDSVFRQLNYGTLFTTVRETIYQRWPISAEHAINGGGADDVEEVAE